MYTSGWRGTAIRKCIRIYKNASLWGIFVFKFAIIKLNMETPEGEVQCGQCQRSIPLERSLFSRRFGKYFCGKNCLSIYKPKETGFLFLGRLLALDKDKKPHLPENT